MKILLKIIVLSTTLIAVAIFFVSGMLFNNSYEVIAVKQLGCLLGK